MDGFNTLFMNNDLFSKTFLGKISFYKGCSAFKKNIIFQRLFTSCTQMNLVAVLTFDGFVSQLENWETQPALIPQQRKFNICPKFDSWMGVYDWTSLPNFPNTAFRFWSKLWIKRDGRSRAFFYGAGVKIHGTGQKKVNSSSDQIVNPAPSRFCQFLRGRARLAFRGEEASFSVEWGVQSLHCSEHPGDD